MQTLETPEEDRARYIEDFAASCEQLGMPRLSGGIVAALLVCEEPEPSSERLSEILRADMSEVERELEPLTRGGLVECRHGLPYEPPGFQVSPEAWSMLLSRQLVSLMTFRLLADCGMSLQESAEGSARYVLRDMHDLYAYAEVELPALLERFALARAGEYEQSPAADPEAETQPEKFSRIRETA